MVDCWTDVLKERRRALERKQRRSTRRSRSRSRRSGRKHARHSRSKSKRRGRSGGRSRGRGRSQSRRQSRSQSRRKRKSSLDLLGERLERAAEWISSATSPVTETEVKSECSARNRCDSGGGGASASSARRTSTRGGGAAEEEEEVGGVVAPSGLPRWLREMEVSRGAWTVVHGDFKAENLFFKRAQATDDAQDEIPDCAACDFQWTGMLCCSCCCCCCCCCVPVSSSKCRRVFSDSSHTYTHRAVCVAFTTNFVFLHLLVQQSLVSKYFSLSVCVCV
jgi:hypothetical protein